MINIFSTSLCLEYVFQEYPLYLKRDTINYFFEKSVIEKKEKALQNIKEDLSKEFEDLANNKALEFAENVIKNNIKKDLPKKWEEYVKECHFEEELQNDLNSALLPFMDAANNTLNYLIEDLYFSVSQIANVEKLTVPFQIDFHGMLKIGGAGIGIIGVILKFCFDGALKVAGGYLAAAALALGAASALFDTKAKRQQREVSKLHTAISEEIKKQSPVIINGAYKKIEHHLEAIVTQIDSIFLRAENEMRFAVKESDRIRSLFSEEEDWVNKFYAWRIVQFLAKEQIPFSKGAVYQEVIDVQRPGKNVICIQCNHKNMDPSVLKDIIADKVTFI